MLKISRLVLVEWFQAPHSGYEGKTENQVKFSDGRKIELPVAFCQHGGDN